MTRKMTLPLAVLLAVGGCSASVSTAVPGASTQATSTQATSTQATSTQATSKPTYSVTGPTTYKVNDQVVLNLNGKPWAKITASDAKVVLSYDSPTGEVEKPDQRASAVDDVFIQVSVTYEALTDGVTYDFFHWGVYCAGTYVVDASNLLLFGAPTPLLDQGTLSSGGKHSGYLIFEVPAKGEVLMSYGGYATVFSIIIRAA